MQDLRDIGFFGRWRRKWALVGEHITPLNLPSSNPKNPLDARPWERIGESLKALFYHAALKAKADRDGLVFRGFSLRLTDEVEKRARGRGKHCLDYLHRQIADHLKRALKPAQGEYGWWHIVIEDDEKGRLHIHGNILFRPDDRKLVDCALRGAGGNWKIKDARTGKMVPCPYQLDWSRGEPNYGWTGYKLKNTWKADPLWRRRMKRRPPTAVRGWTVSFDGHAVTCTKDVKDAAKVIHKQAVADVNAFRESHKSILIAGIIH